MKKNDLCDLLPHAVSRENWGEEWRKTKSTQAEDDYELVGSTEETKPQEEIVQSSDDEPFICYD